ncbi:MAG: hypothetical protein LBK27_02340 [Treponema sp.]|nr:hypothetical protein [Treponema sp.]
MTKKIIASLLICLFLFPGWGFAEIKPDIKGFDVSILDYHFSRADRSPGPESWMAEARRGIAAVFSAWELVGPDLYADPLLAEEARETLRQWSEEELENRYTQWLYSRFFGAAAAIAAEEVSDLIGKAHIQYTYHRDEEGNILYDDLSGDPLVIRPQDGQDFEYDRGLWRQDVLGGIREKEEALETGIINWFPELLASVDEERRDGFEKKLQAAHQQAFFNLTKEFENLAAREERLLTARRTGDVWSLRKKTEDEAAAETTARLIGEAELICAEGIASLAGRIEAAAAGTGDLNLAGSDWLEAYREQFDRGLKAWQDAEERFFIRRLEWEQETGSAFSQGEEAWALAFTRFENARLDWEQQARALFESGETLFKNASATLEKSISEAKIEFEQDARLRTDAGTARARAWVDMYITSSSVVSAARENISYWVEKYTTQTVPAITGDEFKTWLEAEMFSFWRKAQSAYEQKYNDSNFFNSVFFDRAIWSGITDVLNGKADEKKRSDLVETLKTKGISFGESYGVFLEINRWFSLYEANMEKARDAREKLINEFNLVMGAGALADILADDVSSEDFNLDEYQIELIRAKAAAAYWEKRVIIAKSVAAYAEELGAGRMTDGEGVRMWEEAKSAYDGAVARYEAEHEKLSAAGNEVLNAEAGLNAAAAELKAAEQELNKLNQQYASLMAVYAVGRSDYVLDEIRVNYQKLLVENSLLDDERPGGVRARYFERALELEWAQAWEETGEILKRLTAGDGGGEKTLAELKARAEKIINLAAGEKLPASLGDFGLEEDDPYYQEILLLLADRDRAIAEEAGSAEANQEKISLIKNSYDGMIRRCLTAAKAAAEREFEIRVAGIRLFAAESGADWYFGTEDNGPPAEELAAFREEGLLRRLISGEEKSSLELLKARIALEIRGLEFFLHEESAPNEPEGELLRILSFFCIADAAGAEQGLDMLKALRERLASDNGFFTADEEYNAYIQWFLSGGSFFRGTEMFLTEQLDEYERARGLLEMYQTYGFRSAFRIREAWTETLESFRGFFAERRMETQGLLPEIEVAAASLFGEAGDISLTAAEFLGDLEPLFSQAPEILEGDFESWKNSFIQYTAALAVYGGREMPRRSGEILAEIEELARQSAAFQEYCRSLGFVDNETSRRITGEYETLRKAEQTLVFSYRIAEAYEQNILARQYAAGEEQKHWRQYLDQAYIGTVDSEIEIAASWDEGVFFDAREKARRDSGTLNDFLSAYSDRLAQWDDTESRSIAESYCLDQEKPWDENILERTPYLLLDNYYIEADAMQRYALNAALIQAEMASLGRSYDFFVDGSKDLRDEIERELEKIAIQEASVHSLAASYLAAADNFSALGSVYDDQYTETKTAYAKMEEGRFLYEIQDAIRRWASTAYLEAETGDPEYCSAHLEKANIVLDALSGLYENAEERRPYENEQYESLYQEYRESFGRMMLSLKTRNMLNKALVEEYQYNEEHFMALQKYMAAFGAPVIYEDDYTVPETPAQWKTRDMIALKDGKLAFNYGDDFSLSTIDDGGIGDLTSFFNDRSPEGTETYSLSQFERALGDLSERMTAYFSTDGKFRQWGLARDYLLRKLIEANGGNEDLKGLYLPPSGYQEDSFEASLYSVFMSMVALLPEALDIEKKQQSAWESMSAAEKADLEFYLILTLKDVCGAQGSSAQGFSYFSLLLEREAAYNSATGMYKYYEEKVKRWWAFGFIYIKDRDEAKVKKDRAAADYNNTAALVRRWQTSVAADASNLSQTREKYQKSCDRIRLLSGESESSDGVNWETIQTALLTMGGLEAEELEQLKKCWEMMNEDIGGTYRDVAEAMVKLSQWTRSTKEDNKRDLEYQWNDDVKDREKKEKAYHEYVEAFMNGSGGRQELADAAEAAFGMNAAARKNHLENLEETLREDLAGAMADGSDYLTEYNALANDYVTLISRAYATRYEAEFMAREAEWSRQREDIREKYRFWQETAGLILERGREDWQTGSQRMKDSYNKWVKDFIAEYDRIGEAWADAYLAGLADKETWLAGASAAAEKASSQALLNLIGADAEMMARAMDTRDPAGSVFSSDIGEAGYILDSLMESAGVRNLPAAYTGISGMADTAARDVRRGVGGMNIWNSGSAQVAAKNLAREANAELAEREAKRLAATAQKSAEQAIQGLEENVTTANRSFRESMDFMFLMEGQWNAEGKNYTKDIVVHSTLFRPVITDRTTVRGYEDYKLEPVEIKTNLSEGYLAGLDAFAIQGLIGNMQKEVKTAAEKIFGADGEKSTIIKAKGLDGIDIVFDPENHMSMKIVERWIDLKDREQSPGKFGAHVGYGPAQRENITKFTRGNFFYDEGAGELGRLLAEFIFWQATDAVGMDKVASAAWDKPMWDSRDSFFEAPSIRTITDVGLQVVGGIVSLVTLPVTGGASVVAMMGLMTAISVSDDLLFNTLDVAGGYKTWDEAGFEFGKALVISAASNALGGAFNGLGGISGGFFAKGAGLAGMMAEKAGNAFGGLMVKTAMKGLEIGLTTTITSALNGVTYSNKDGWGYSEKVFSQGMDGLPSAVFSGMANTFTGGLMNIGLEGFTDVLHETGTRLSGLVGGLAGEGVKYAMGGDFTLNLFNFGLISQGKINSGFLELHLGQDGARMNFGTGGADVSLGTLVSAAKGLEAWAVNFELLTSGEDAARKYASQMRTLYSGTEVNRAEYEAILTGRTKVVEDRNAEETQSKLNEESGVKTIFLGQNALSDASRFGLNVYFSHESYRDGINNGKELQEIERDNAVAGHIDTTRQLVATYGTGSIGSGMLMEALVYTCAGKQGNTGVQRAILDAYDTSADFWLVKLDGMIAGTPGDPRIWREVLNDDGTVTKELVPGSAEQGSQAASLVSLLGEDRVIKRLGFSDPMSIDNYDGQTLKDVFGWSDEQLKKNQRAGITLSANSEQRAKLLGEALLKNNGYTWDGTSNTWEGSSLNIADVPFYGNVGIVKENGAYLPFTITSSIYRAEDAYKLFAYDSTANTWNPNEDYRDNTKAYFYHRNLITGETQAYQFEGPLNFVDNADGDNFGANQAYNHPKLGTIQGATVAAGSMNIRLGTSGTYGEVLLFTDFTDLKGERFGGNGMRDGIFNDPRTLYHATTYGTSDSCLVSFDVKNALKGNYFFNTNMNHLKNIFDLYPGYEIKTTLVDWNKRATPGGGSRAKGYKE